MQLKVKRPLLIYHGGKFLLSKWIISHFPKHQVYIECFGGAASVLMQKPRSYTEIYNDKWDTVVNVFEVLRDPVTAAILERNLRLTPYSRTEFNKSKDVNSISDKVERARLTILRSFAGFGSASTNPNYATGFRAKAYSLKDWVSYPDHITSYVNRLKGVVIENKDYREIISQHDNDDTLIYLDPPYVHSTRNIQGGNGAYAYEMGDSDHVEMAELLNTINGMAVISGYNNELYNKLFCDWRKIERKTYTNRDADRIECLWLNEKAAKKLNNKLF